MPQNSSAKHYQKNKQRLKKVCERYQHLSEEEKNKKQQYGHRQYLNLPEGEKQNREKKKKFEKRKKLKKKKNYNIQKINKIWKSKTAS